MDWEARAKAMHRRAQKAEGRIERAIWWLNIGKRFNDKLRKRNFLYIEGYYLNRVLGVLQNDKTNKP